MGGGVKRLLLVACEPQALGAGDDGEDEMSMGLSPPVRAAVGEAVLLIESLVARLVGESAGGEPTTFRGNTCTSYPSP
jgi:hypothetical protein